MAIPSFGYSAVGRSRKEMLKQEILERANPGIDSKSVLKSYRESLKGRERWTPPRIVVNSGLEMDIAGP